VAGDCDYNDDNIIMMMMMMMMMMIIIIITRQGTAEKNHIGHCTHTWKVTTLKCKTSVTSNSITCTINYNHRISATLYILEARFISGV
jgi:hypothetical protein